MNLSTTIPSIDHRVAVVRLAINNPDVILFAPFTQGPIGRTIFKVIPSLEHIARFKQLLESAVCPSPPEESCDSFVVARKLPMDEV